MNELTQEILDTVQVGAMATVNRDRTPLVTPLHFARMDDEIVWVSDRQSLHSHNAFRTGKAEFAVWNDRKQAVFLKTTVRELQESDVERAEQAYRDKLGDFMPAVEHPQWYTAPIGHIDDNSTTENWLHYVA